MIALEQSDKREGLIGKGSFGKHAVIKSHKNRGKITIASAPTALRAKERHVAELKMPGFVRFHEVDGIDDMLDRNRSAKWRSR